MVGFAALCAPGLADEFVYTDEWGQAQFALYAWNYWTIPWSVSHGLPVFGLAGDQPLYYLNHPWLASFLLALWGLPFGVSELSVRICSVLLGLVRLGAVAAIGRRLGGERVGLLAALLFGIAPLSVQLGRVYGMESLQLTFFLLAFSTGLQQRFWPTAILLALSQCSDVYGLLLLPWLALAAWRQPEHRRRYLGYGVVLVGTQLATTGYLLALGLLQESWSKGAGRYTWGLEALRPGYYVERARDLLLLNGNLTPLLAVWGGWRQRRWLVGPLGPWVVLCLVQLIICSRWLTWHSYHLLFWTPPLAWLAGSVLATWRWPLQLLACGAAVALSWAPTRVYLTPLFSHDPILARELKTTLHDDDLVLALPPHMAYYLRHRSVVPYFYFWKAGIDQASREAMVRDLVRSTGTRYRRIIFFTMFARDDGGRVPTPDYSHTLDGLPEWKRMVPAPGPDLEVWKRD